MKILFLANEMINFLVQFLTRETLRNQFLKTIVDIQPKKIFFLSIFEFYSQKIFLFKYFHFIQILPLKFVLKSIKFSDIERIKNLFNINLILYSFTSTKCFISCSDLQRIILSLIKIKILGVQISFEGLSKSKANKSKVTNKTFKTYVYT